MAISMALSFRVSDAAVDWLNSQALPGESLHATAKRLIEHMASGVGHHATHDVGNNVGSSVNNIEEIVDTRIQQKIEELESDLYSRLVDQLNAVITQRLAPLDQGASELMQERERLLGESAA